MKGFPGFSLRSIAAAAVLTVALPQSAPAAGRMAEPQTQTQSQTQTQTPPPPPPAPANLAKIRDAVNRPPTLKIEEGQLRIYVEVIAKWPSFAEMVKGVDLMNGPTNGGNPMTHKEFLNMVTPKEMYSSVGIRPGEVLTMALVNYFGQKAIKKGLEEIRQARDAKEIAEIRARIDRELAALRGGR